MAPAVHLREAVALAGRFPLLAGVNLDVDEGEIVHLSGPNGAGKSSLLRLCCGLVPLASGEGMVLGHDLSLDRRSVRREVGLLGHASFLYDDLTVEENLRFALRSFGLGAAESASRYVAAMELLGLSGRLASLRVARLSAGQRRRAAFAVLVARRPRLWLLDEPHACLDEEARGVLDEVVAGARVEGATVLVVSHERERASGIADRVLTVTGGRVLPVGDEPRPAVVGEAAARPAVVGDEPRPAVVGEAAAGLGTAAAFAGEPVHVA